MTGRVAHVATARSAGLLVIDCSRLSRSVAAIAMVIVRSIRMLGWIWGCA